MDAPWVARSPADLVEDAALPAPAGFWRRAAALLVDGLVVWGLLLVGELPVAALEARELAARAFGWTYTLVVPGAYFVLSHGTSGQTLGKRLLGARVVA